MDDFNISSLHESRNEWASLLVSILTPLIIDGYKSILEESIRLCRENNEMDKYLMTYQNLISRIPKWNTQIIENERKRICEKSRCTYLEELLTCVHVVQLKVMTAMRVGQKQKKIDINIPKLDDFIHKCYINAARKIYKNVYLFEIHVEPLQVQKNYRELEIIIQECILNTLRESIPVEAILKAYMDETVEEDVQEEIKEQIVHEPIKVPDTTTTAAEPATAISFNELDTVIKPGQTVAETVTASKDIATLEKISEERHEQRKLEALAEDDGDDPPIKLTISSEPLSTNALEIETLGDIKLKTDDFPELSEIELLPDL